MLTPFSHLIAFLCLTVFSWLLDASPLAHLIYQSISVCFEVLLGPLVPWVASNATPHDPQILSASVCSRPSASWLISSLCISGVFLKPTLGSFMGVHTPQPEPGHLLESDLAPQPQVSPTFAWVSPTVPTLAPALRLSPPETFPDHIMLPYMVTHLCSPESHLLQPDLIPVCGQGRLTSPHSPPPVR